MKPLCARACRRCEREYGRVIQTISKNNVEGYDIVSNKYNFAGELLESKHKHTSEIAGAKYLVYLYTYDAVGRLLKTELSENADASGAIVINTITYNELGQVQVKKIHSEDGWDYLQTVNYGYNIKGAITYINDPEYLGNNLFAMKLYYDESIEGMYHPNTYKDGKISAIQWNSDNLNDVKTYMYTYDDLNRLTHASYHPGSKYSVDIDYDLNGNITHLERHGELLQQEKSSIGPPIIATTVDLIDDLFYTYNGNQITTVSDAISDDINTQLNNDFRDYNSEGMQEYFYDANGNMIEDKNKGITNIEYNHLNQPIEVTFIDKRTKYLYTATGGMLKTVIYDGGMEQSKTEYCGAYVYIDNKLRYIQIPGGRITYTLLNHGYLKKQYEYNLTDHLGNVRVTFTDDGNGNAEILQEDHYYPFGLRMSGQHYTVPNINLVNKYLYNGKELQDQTNYYDYGFRQMDPQLGRWHVVDALAEMYLSTSPYAYVMNDPINRIDVMGLWSPDPYPKKIKFHHSKGDDSDYIYSGGYLNKILGLATAHHNNFVGGPTLAMYDDYMSLSEAQRAEFSLHDFYQAHRQLDIHNQYTGSPGLSPVYGMSWVGGEAMMGYPEVWSFKGMYVKGYENSSDKNGFLRFTDRMEDFSDRADTWANGVHKTIWDWDNHVIRGITGDIVTAGASVPFLVWSAGINVSWVLHGDDASWLPIISITLTTGLNLGLPTQPNFFIGGENLLNSADQIKRDLIQTYVKQDGFLSYVGGFHHFSGEFTPTKHGWLFGRYLNSRKSAGFGGVSNTWILYDFYGN